MSENPRRGRQARNFTTNVPKILDLKSFSEQIFSRKLSLGAPEFQIARGRFEITSPITPELYDTKSYYQSIVSKTKCENLSLGIFINVRERSQSI